VTRQSSKKTSTVHLLSGREADIRMAMNEEKNDGKREGEKEGGR